MESNAFKTVTFGGFDKQSVAAYIEQTAKEYESALETLRKENETLKDENAALRRQDDEHTERLSALQEKLSGADAAKEELGGLRPAYEALQAQVEALRPDAESYRQFRDRVGDIECDARRRSAELESSTAAKLNELVSACRAQYETLTGSFETASHYITSELRKVEVNFSQLPRAMDQIGSELSALEHTLQLDESEAGQ